MLFVPTRKRGKEEEADERKNNSDDSERGTSATFAQEGTDRKDTHIKYGKTILSLKVFATHIRFSGS